MDSSQYQIGYCFERANNLPGAAINKFFYAKSIAGLVPKAVLEASGNMLPSGRTAQRVLTGFDVGIKIDCDPDVDSIAPRRAWQNGMYGIATPVAGVQEWTLHPRETGETPPAYVGTADYEITDGGDPVLFTGCVESDLEIKIENRKIVGISETIAGCLASYTSVATAVAATYTGKPVVVGIWGKLTASPIKAKVEAIAGGGNDGYVRFTSGADPYAGANIAIKFDKFVEIKFGSGLRAGVNRNNSLWIMFPSGAGALAATDEFTFTNQRTIASPTFPGRDPLSTAAFTVAIDGTEYGGTPNNPGFGSATLKVSFPKEPNVNGGIWPHSQRRKDDPVLTLKVSRDREDQLLLQKALRAERSAILLNMWGNPIGTTGYDEYWGFSMPEMQSVDVVRDINKKGQLMEDADLVATGLTGPIYNEMVRCTVAAI